MTRLKLFLLCCILPFCSFSQADEFAAFKKEINFYEDFLRSKYDSLKVNEVNQKKFRARVDEVFKKFVLHEKSAAYDKLITDRENVNEKFIQSDPRFVLYVTSFQTTTKTYIVYSYKSSSKRNFFIKENESNQLVYEGNSQSYLINGIYAVDEKHMLLIEEDGDKNTSRSCTVLSTTNKLWKPIKAFEGMAFGQVPAEYFKKKFVKKRQQFELACEFGHTMSAPKDVNQINFNPSTKTISYKQYSDNRQFKLITSRWENGVFKIDDYGVGEQLPSNDVVVPF